MAHEIMPWRQPDCCLAVDVDSLTSRETYSQEINKMYGEGGGLNANYRTMEALAIVSSLLASNNLRYGIHWYFKTAGSALLLDFCDQKTREGAELILLMNYAVVV